MAGYAHPEALVDTAWVAAHGRDSGVRLVDGLAHGAQLVPYLMIHVYERESAGAERMHQEAIR